MRFLMFVSDAHGGFGGIAQYNRDAIDAMSAMSSVDEIVVVPRIINTPTFEVPSKVRYVREASTGLKGFLLSSAREAIRGRSYDLVYCAHMNLLPVAVAASRIRSCPLLLAIYGTDAWFRPRNIWTAKALTQVNLIISISQLTLDRLFDWSPYLKAQKAIVPNAIRVENYALGEKSAELVERYGLAGRRIIMTLGRMDPGERAKGFDEIIDLMPRLARHSPDIYFLCAGDGGDRSRLQAKAMALGVSDRVVFTGRIPEERKAEHFRLADAYIMPSRWEGFGFVVLEALACGIPVVASIADGTREAVRGGELGLLVDPKDPDALEAAILTALSKPKAIPPGLDYFSFGKFQTRLSTAIGGVVSGARPVD